MNELITLLTKVLQAHIDYMVAKLEDMEHTAYMAGYTDGLRSVVVVTERQ